MNRRLVILEVVAPPLYWLMLATSLVVLLRGHNEPGGGFIGGLLAVTASVLWAVAHAPADAVRRLPLRSPVRLAALGVLIGVVAGLPAWWLGQPYLTHLWATVPLGFAVLPVSTVLVFDLGVYLCVWGALGGYALALLDSDDAPDPTRGRELDGDRGLDPDPDPDRGRDRDRDRNGDGDGDRDGVPDGVGNPAHGNPGHGNPGHGSPAAVPEGGPR
jgi:multicomponent Na+:H+ antiporter subunit B